MLRTNLEFARLEGDDVRVILVTSAVEQEGKSTTAANLALAEARAGRRVALVDLDLRRPYLDRFFGAAARAGDHRRGARDDSARSRRCTAIDLAVGAAGVERPASLTEANGHGEHGSLDVLVSGPLPPDPGEFVGTRTARRDPRRAARGVRPRDRRHAAGAARGRRDDAVGATRTGLLVVTRLNVVRRPMLRELRRQLDDGTGAEARATW